MRTLFLLDRADLAALRSGEPFLLRIGDATITLQAERPAKVKAPASETPVRRRRHSARFKKQVARYAAKHSPGAAAHKFGVVRSVVARWLEAA